MSRRLVARAIIALAVPALLVPALSTPAVAARGASVPSVEKVAGIYPHLAGGSATESTDKVKGLTKKCELGKAVKGASITSSAYSSADPAAAFGTADAPIVGVSALKFRNAADAVKYLKSGSKASKCAPAGTGDDVKVTVKKFKVKLGDQSQGFTVAATYQGSTFTSQSVQVRDGKFLLVVSASTIDGSVPSAKQAVSLAKLAVKGL
jgi:hypothetical protein